MSEKQSRRDFVLTAGMAATGMMANVEPASAEPAVQAPAVTASKASRLRQLLRGPAPFHCINAFDGPSARLIELSGFESVWVGGSLAAMEHGLPDWGLTNTQELLEFAVRIANNVSIPTMADCDNGGGSPLTVYRATKDFERAGLAGMLIEDRIRLERIGQKADVIPTAQMVERIRAAVDARSEMAIVARSDSLATDRTLEEAIERGKAYCDAGADAVLYPGVQPIETTRRLVASLPKAVLSQMGHDRSITEARNAGVRVFFFTSMVHDIALAAYLQALTELKTTGMMAKTYNAHQLPRGMTAQLEHADEILARAKKYKVAP